MDNNINFIIERSNENLPPGLKYTNQEKRLLKRSLFYDYLNKKQDEFKKEKEEEIKNNHHREIKECDKYKYESCIKPIVQEIKIIKKNDIDYKKELEEKAHILADLRENKEKIHTNCRELKKKGFFEFEVVKKEKIDYKKDLQEKAKLLKEPQKPAEKICMRK